MVHASYIYLLGNIRHKVLSSRNDRSTKKWWMDSSGARAYGKKEVIEIRRYEYNIIDCFRKKLLFCNQFFMLYEDKLLEHFWSAVRNPNLSILYKKKIHYKDTMLAYETQS